MPLLLLAGNAANEYRTSRPKVIKEHWGLKIGTTKQDVIFFKGNPTIKTDEDSWAYSDNSSGSEKVHFVYFKNGRVVTVATSADPFESLNSISIGDDYDGVLEKLGNPDYVSYSKESTGRILNYKRFGMAVGFEQGLVDYLAMNDPSNPIRYDEEQQN